jgi:hypothetical protein
LVASLRMTILYLGAAKLIPLQSQKKPWFPSQGFMVAESCVFSVL